jgi:hypothetical protein
VVGIEEELRRASFDFVSHDKEPFDTIFFHEDVIPTSLEWGHWSLSADSGAEHLVDNEDIQLQFKRFVNIWIQ